MSVVVALVMVMVSVMIPVAATGVLLTGGDGFVGVQVDTPLMSELTVQAGFLHTNAGRGSGKIHHLGVRVSPPTVLLNWSVELGYQYQVTDYGDGGGLGLRGALFVPFPVAWLSAGGYLFYMPAGLTQGRINRGYDCGMQVRFTFKPRINAYVGYRVMRTSFRNMGEKVLYQGPVLGFGVSF